MAVRACNTGVIILGGEISILINIIGNRKDFLFDIFIKFNKDYVSIS